MNSKAAADKLVEPGAKRVIHFGWVDYARGMAILLVVYRHCLVGLQRAGVEVSVQLYTVQEFLYNVRMPVFFVLSGIFLNASLKKNGRGLIFKKKAANLLYPYIIWSVFLISLQLIFSAYTNSDRTARDFLYIFLKPRELDHMWYLLALFNTTILYLLLAPLFERNKFMNLLLAVLLHFASFYLGPWSFFFDISYHYVFLVSGVIVSDHIYKWESVTIKKNLILLLLVAPLFIAGQLFWLRSIGKDYQSEYWWQLGPYLLIIMVACFVFYLVSRLFEAWGKMSFLERIGKYSLYIYILHIHVIAFIRIGFLKIAKVENIEYILPISVVLAVVLPIYVFKVIRKYNWYFLISLPQKKIK